MVCIRIFTVLLCTQYDYLVLPFFKILKLLHNLNLSNNGINGSDYIGIKR
jgi:hypothetical protein